MIRVCSDIQVIQKMDARVHVTSLFIKGLSSCLSAGNEWFYMLTCLRLYVCVSMSASSHRLFFT